MELRADPLRCAVDQRPLGRHEASLGADDRGEGEHFEQETKSFIAYVQSANRTNPNAPIEVPGDAERRYRVQRAKALPIDSGTLRTLDEAAKMINELRGAALPSASSLVAR